MPKRPFWPTEMVPSVPTAGGESPPLPVANAPVLTPVSKGLRPVCPRSWRNIGHGTEPAAGSSIAGNKIEMRTALVARAAMRECRPKRQIKVSFGRNDAGCEKGLNQLLIAG